MPKRPPEKPGRVDVIKGGRPATPADGPIIWFELNEVDARLLAKGLVSSEVRAQAKACIGWLEDDPISYVDEDFLKLAEKVG